MAQSGYGPPLLDASTLGNLGNTFWQAEERARKQALEEQKRQTFAAAAQGGDLGKLGMALLGTGDVQGAAALIGLSQKQADRAREAAWETRYGGEFGGGQPAPAQGQQPMTLGNLGAAASQPAQSLIQNESGGNWQAQNNAVGAGGQRGHFGRLQFGQARLQEAAAAGAIPQGTTPQAFMASPELQQRAEAWHFNDIDQFIRGNGLDKTIGRAINGVPITLEGMRAVAHLGGKDGLAKFIASDGRYNPSDENGTSLMDYLARHGGSGRQPVQVAENEADVQRLESQMAAGAGPFQTVQADVPAPGASPAQGFAIPSGQIEASIANDPRVLNLQRALAGAPERFKPSIQSRLNILVEELKAQRQQEGTPESAREFVWARKNGLTTARTPAEYAREKADNAPTTRVVKQADGSEVAVQWDATNRQWIPLQAPEGGNAVRPHGQKLTEQQSKDLIYHNRGIQALEAFEPIAGAYADGLSRVATNVPGGNYVVPEQFQMAQQAGLNFLASILRKDTGAAITTSEEKRYGEIFLPQPGDKPGTLAQKAEARKQAIDAIRGGLGTAEVLALGQRLVQREPGQAAPAKPENNWTDLGGGLRIREKR